jgi:DNA-binding response OmpR family regulator
VPRSPLLLVVEDEPTLAAAVAARLTGEGFTVQVAHDGQAALDAAAATPPDLVVLDLMLPGSTGSRCAGGCRRSGPSGAHAHRPADEADRVIGLGSAPTTT